MLTKAFIKRVREERIVDTREYRYVAKACYNADELWLEIRRLPLEALDTTAAIDGWETVEIIKEITASQFERAVIAAQIAKHADNK